MLTFLIDCHAASLMKTPFYSTICLSFYFYKGKCLLLSDCYWRLILTHCFCNFANRSLNHTPVSRGFTNRSIVEELTKRFVFDYFNRTVAHTSDLKSWDVITASLSLLVWVCVHLYVWDILQHIATQMSPLWIEKCHRGSKGGGKGGRDLKYRGRVID